MTTKIYIGFIKETLKTEGIEVADKANKMALEDKAITIEQYGKAAQEIVKAYLSK